MFEQSRSGDTKLNLYFIPEFSPDREHRKGVHGVGGLVDGNYIFLLIISSNFFLEFLIRLNPTMLARYTYVTRNNKTEMGEKKSGEF